MPSRVLLLNANRCTTPDPVFPLGLAYLTAALRHAGHECFLADRLAQADFLGSAAQYSRPNVIGISLRNVDDVLIRKRETFYNELSLLITSLRDEHKCPIVLGGSGYSMFPESLLQLTGADFGIAGEGEPAMLALLAALETGNDYQHIPGLVFRAAGKIRANPGRPGGLECGLTDTDWSPAIAEYYVRSSSMLSVQTQRGCAFHCCYCTYPVIEGRHHRRRSAEWVAEEFLQAERLGARYVFVVDSVFNSSPKHVVEICEALLARRVKIPWGCFLRPQALTRDLMRLMARAGLKHIEFGSDSLCDEVLAAYHKEFTFGDIYHSSELARAEQIEHCHYLIAGGPGETEQTLEQGFGNSRKMTSAVFMAIAGMRIYPETQLFARASAEGVVASDADLLSPAYYIAPGLTADTVLARLETFARRSPNWIVGNPDPGYRDFVARLRRRGVAGPLWSYFSLLQHVRPDRLTSRS